VAGILICGSNDGFTSSSVPCTPLLIIGADSNCVAHNLSVSVECWVCSHSHQLGRSHVCVN
jgi:hypothetical protein